jgi:hypothetical protein
MNKWLWGRFGFAIQVALVFVFDMGARMVKWTKKVLRYTKSIIFYLS